MAYPTSISIDGNDYRIESENIWNDIQAQLQNFMRGGRILLRIGGESLEHHVLVTDGTSLNFQIQDD